jgi:hypothetical protein
MLEKQALLGFEMPEIDPRKIEIANIEHLIKVNNENFKSVERLFNRETNADRQESYRLEMSTLTNTLANLDRQRSILLNQAPMARPPSPLPPLVPPAPDSDLGGF